MTISDDEKIVEAMAIAIGRYFRDPKAKPNDDALAQLFSDSARAALAVARQHLVPQARAKALPYWPGHANFKQGDLVRKKSGAEWSGRIVGWYSTENTPMGYAVESDTHKGSVQIYPEAALKLKDA